MTDELNRLDQAFAGNLLLTTFSTEVRGLIEPSAELVELTLGTSVQRRGQDVDWSYFPFGTTMISLIVELPDSRSVQVASIGREGAVGGIVSCGHAPAFAEAQVMVGGPALRVPMRALEDAKNRSSFVANLFCRFSDYLLAEVMQSTACNSFHSIQQRAARWLLTAQDRAGDRIELTQEALAGLLAVQRTTVNAVVRALQEKGSIAVRRGRVIVVDRAGLKRHACECYAIVEDHFGAVIGPSGTGS
jgi:DNA-binding transcriptional regulator YhcF (GntR family)